MAEHAEDLSLGLGLALVTAGAAEAFGCAVAAMVAGALLIAYGLLLVIGRRG